MNKKDISIVTMTRAKPDDYELHRAALRELAALRLPTVITDGGSGEEFLSYLNSFPNFIVQRAARAGAFLQIKTSFDRARQFATPYVLYTEPDKQFFFQQRLAEFIERASSHSTTGIIIPARTAESFASYPESQRFTEAFTNQLCSRIVGKDGDFSIWNDSPLSPYAACEQTWIEGRKYFDRAQDLAGRAALAQERDALVARAKAQKKDGGAAGPPGGRRAWPPRYLEVTDMSGAECGLDGHQALPFTSETLHRELQNGEVQR